MGVKKIILPPQYTLQTGGNGYCIILGVGDDLLYRYFTLQYSNSAAQSNILWIKVRKSNHQIVAIRESSGVITSSFINTLFHGNKLITYAIKEGVGLVRYELNCNSYASLTLSMEVVDGSVSISFATFAAIKRTRIGGHLFLFYNQEKLVLSEGGKPCNYLYAE